MTPGSVAFSGDALGSIEFHLRGGTRIEAPSQRVKVFRLDLVRRILDSNSMDV